MRKTRFVWLVALAMALCVSGISAQVTRTLTKSDRFDFGAGGTVAVTGAPQGSIHITGSKTNEIEITAQIQLNAPTEADLSKLAEITGFVLDESIAKVTILSFGTHSKQLLKKSGKKVPKNLIGLPFRIDYTISVPRYCDLEIDGGVGDITVENVEGSMFINFIEAKAVLTFATGAANVTIQKGSVDATFGRGPWRGRNANIQVGTGGIVAHVPSTLSADLDVIILRSGKIDNSFPGLKPRDRKAPLTEKSIIARAGPGGPPVKLGVGDGTIKIDVLSY
jgi:hypothetical protein